MSPNENPDNPNDEGLIPPTLCPAKPRPRRESWYWTRRVLAGNPLFLISAALLLFGINRLSVDEGFLEAETAKLAFNFSALQVYEVLLVVVSIVLARRRIWYDSVLLFGLENMLVLVPFILVTQALLIGNGVALALCATGTFTTVVRFASLRKFIPELKLPPRLLGFGLVFLAVNLAVPVYYRWRLEEGLGDFWEQPNQWCWLAGLPLLQLLANALPPGHRGAIAPQRSWLPIGVFELWVAATAVHFWCVTYVDKLPCPPYLLAPLLWALAWTAYYRIEALLSRPASGLRTALLLAPAFTTFLGAAHENSRIFLALTFLNMIGYARFYLSNRGNPVVFQLLLASTVGLMAGIPLDPGRHLLPELSRGQCVAAAFGAFVILQALFSRRPHLGICAAVVASMAPALLNPGPHAHLSVQTGLVFLLLHSLGWADREQKGVSVLRTMTAVVWMLHSIAFTLVDPIQAVWIVSAAALLIACGYFGARLITGCWAALIVPVSAAVSCLVAPLNYLVRKILTSPPGLLAIAASFLLFGVGTFLALTKPRWHRCLPEGSEESK